MFDLNAFIIDEKPYKTLLFTTLDMWQSKIRNNLKLIA